MSSAVAAAVRRARRRAVCAGACSICVDSIDHVGVLLISGEGVESCVDTMINRPPAAGSVALPCCSYLAYVFF
jgi:hypothetical protein